MRHGDGATEGAVALSTKDPDERVRLRFEFCALLADDESISSAELSVVVRAGDAGQPLTGLLSGAPVIEGARVLQVFAGGLLGSIYRVKCRATTSAGNVYALSGDVPVNTVFGV